MIGNKNTSRTDEVRSHIEEWIKHLTSKQILLGGFSICPFAKGSPYGLVETDGSNISPPSVEFDLIIYLLPDYLDSNAMHKISNRYNNLFPELIFLPDGKRYTEINGVQTNNDRYNLILCQYRYNLELARKKLSETNYYSFWDKEYLKEILET